MEDSDFLVFRCDDRKLREFDCFAALFCEKMEHSDIDIKSLRAAEYYRSIITLGLGSIHSEKYITALAMACFIIGEENLWRSKNFVFALKILMEDLFPEYSTEQRSAITREVIIQSALIKPVLRLRAPK